jgi:hypothetical protein
MTELEKKKLPIQRQDWQGNVRVDGYSLEPNSSMFLIVGVSRFLVVSAISATQRWNLLLSSDRRNRGTSFLSLVTAVVVEGTTLRSAHVVATAEATAVLGHLTVGGHVGTGELSSRLLEATRARAWNSVRSVDSKTCWNDRTLRRHGSSCTVLRETEALRSGRVTGVTANSSSCSGGGRETFEVGGRGTVLTPLYATISNYFHTKERINLRCTSEDGR